MSNKGLKEDFLIFLGGWHDGLPCPTREGTPGRGPVVNLCTLAHVSLLFHIIFASDKFLLRFNDFVDRHSTVPQLNLVNRQSLDKILRSEVFVNEADGQLRVAHVILGYKPISLGFQAPKCVIKANDPHLHRISMAFEGFVVLESVPILEGTPLTQPLFVGIHSIGASPFQPIVKEEEEEKEKEEKGKELEEIVDLLDS